VDPEGNVFVADGGNHRIIRLDGENQDFATYAGGDGGDGYDDGLADVALFSSPTGLTVDLSGDLIVADQENHAVRKICTEDGEVTTIAGCLEEGFADGPARDAKFNCPTGVACDKQGNIYVVDGGNHRVRKLGGDDMVSTFAGCGQKGFKDGKGAQAQFNYPGGIATDEDDNVIVADYGNHRIRLISKDGTVKTLAGDGTEGYKDGGSPQNLPGPSMHSTRRSS
jgi:sugar lactone lactonase YvrE